MLPLGAPEGVLRAWSAPHLALTASFVSSAPRLPRSLLLKPWTVQGPHNPLALAQFVAALPALSWALTPCQPWQEPPVPFHLGTGSLGLEHSSADAGEQSPEPGGRGCPPAPSTPCVPPSCGVSRTPGSSSSLPGHPQPSRERARCVQLGHVASPNPCCPEPCPAP